MQNYFNNRILIQGLCISVSSVILFLQINKNLLYQTAQSQVKIWEPVRQKPFTFHGALFLTISVPKHFCSAVTGELEVKSLRFILSKS